MNDTHRIGDLEDRLEKLEDKFESVMTAAMDMIDRLHGELVRAQTSALEQTSGRVDNG